MSEHSADASKSNRWLGVLLGGAAAAAVGLATALAEPEGIRDLTPATEEQHVNFKLNGKVAFITGGGSGIGHHVALVLAKSGCDVAVLDINAKLAEETAALIRAQTGRRAIAFHVDVRNYKALEHAAAETVKQLGRLDFCVANAGIVRGGSVVNMPENELTDIIDVNIKGVFNTVKAASREMIKLNQGGRVIAISSANAEIAGSGASAYCGTKAAVKMMVRCWAQDLIPFGITVNCIGPGATDTALMIAQVDNAEARQGLLSAIPMGRMAHPAEVGWLCAFYCSQEAAYLTGTFMLQDGGLRDHTSAATPEILEIQKQRTQLSGDALLAAVTSQQQDQTKAMQDQRKKFGLQ